jgi:DNA sulfur modification protein DndE
MPVEQIRLSQAAKEQLLRLKRRTGIKNWNVLCRWSFCRSLSEPTPPSPITLPADSSVEMTWKTFGGVHADLYWALLRWRCHKDGFSLDEETLQQQFRLHLHRGIAYLSGNRRIQTIEDFVVCGGNNAERLEVDARHSGEAQADEEAAKDAALVT